MSNGIAIDTTEFSAALRQYVRMTSKAFPVALNGKAKDLALRAAQRTPKSQMTAAQFKKQQTDPEFVGFIAKRIFDKRGGGRTYQQIYERTEGTMALRKFSKGYMRSGYVKASKQFRNTKDASSAAAQVVLGKHDGTKANVKQATERVLAAAFDIGWSAKNEKDASAKQAIVDRPIAAAIRFVTEDMRKYILRKMEQEAKKISATTARAVGKVFA